MMIPNNCTLNIHVFTKMSITDGVIISIINYAVLNLNIKHSPHDYSNVKKALNVQAPRTCHDKADINNLHSILNGSLDVTDIIAPIPFRIILPKINHNSTCHHIKPHMNTTIYVMHRCICHVFSLLINLSSLPRF